MKVTCSKLATNIFRMNICRRRSLPVYNAKTLLHIKEIHFYFEVSVKQYFKVFSVITWTIFVITGVLIALGSNAFRAWHLLLNSLISISGN